jgi:hypothetical protein
MVYTEKPDSNLSFLVKLPMPTLFSSGSDIKTADKPNISNSHHIHKPAHMQPLAAYAERPDDVRFETQEEKETVELFLRQHPIVNLPWILLTLVLLISPTFIFPLFIKILPFAIPFRFILVFSVFWYVATFGFVLTNILRWFFNIYIVTNERIVDIDFYYLLYKHFSEAELDKIQDISYTSSGLMATIFNYGNVLVETAAEIPNIDFDKVPHPQKIVETIRNLAENLPNHSNKI